MKNKLLVLFIMTFVFIVSITSEEKIRFLYHYGVYDDMDSFQIIQVLLLVLIIK